MFFLCKVDINFIVHIDIFVWSNNREYTIAVGKLQSVCYSNLYYDKAYDNIMSKLIYYIEQSLYQILC